MKILKIEDGKGFFCSDDKNWKPVDELNKDDLMLLLNLVLGSEVEMDEYDEQGLSNQAHQIIYKSVHEKFQTLSENKSKFKDESDRLYLEAIERYQQ